MENTTHSPAENEHLRANLVADAHQAVQDWAAQHRQWLDTRGQWSEAAKAEHQARRDQVLQAEPGGRFPAALQILSGTDGYVTHDMNYAPWSAARLLGHLGFDPYQVLPVIEARIDERGEVSAENFAAALGVLVGEPEAAAAHQRDMNLHTRVDVDADERD